ncbi:hypothetical protein [Brachybacterium sp. GPGPB12]|uniref:hypothetical protein n=1 Tax=Brachybacterium sp. GPGPB12 TaxID=3023517 RepID=UPI003134446C
MRGRARLGRNPHRPDARTLDLHLELAEAVAEGRPKAAESAAREIVGGALRDFGGD